MLKFKKIISFLVLLGILASSFYLGAAPAQAMDGGGGWAAAAAGWAKFAKYVLKEFVLDLLARVAARLQLNGALSGIANQVIQSGRTGRTPAFIQNWRKLMTEGEYRGEDVFRAVLANTAQCPYFRNEMVGLFGVRNVPPLVQNTKVGNYDPYTLRARCTMPRAWSIQSYRQSFSGNGGWDALVRLSQPQNNFYGSLLMSLNELEKQRNLEARADHSEGTSGQGFLGVRKNTQNGSSCDNPPQSKALCENCLKYAGTGEAWCFSNSGGPKANSCISAQDVANEVCTSYTRTIDGCSAIPSTPVNSQARCTFLGNVTSPSKILGDASSNFIDSNLKWLTTSDEISEILGNFIQGMLDKLANFAVERVPGKVVEPKKDQYNQCTNQCYNNSTGSQLSLCIDNCYKKAGVDLPPDYGECSFGTTGSCTQPPPPGVFCSGTDVDNDGNICDASIGEDTSTCPTDCPAAPAAQCSDSLNNDNDFDSSGNPLIDAPGIGTNPDPDCNSPFDNSEAAGGATQCSDGFDNDGDKQADFAGAAGMPRDTDCTSATDNSEISFVATLCAGTNYAGPCQSFTASNPDLGNPSTTIGPDNTESLTATPIIYNPGFIVELCRDPGYGNCTTITATMLQPPGQPSGGISDLRNTPGVGDIGWNDIQSIRITQP